MSGIEPGRLEVYRVFLASPGDVDKERKSVRRFFEDYNRNIGEFNGVRFDVLNWEHYANAGAGRPQKLIIEQLLERYRGSLALFIGILAQRFGTPTGKYKSGTEEEFDWAFKNRENSDWPQIKLFIRRIEKVEFPADLEEAQAALEQWKMVKAFRAKVQQEGENQLFYQTYNDLENFREVLGNDLTRWLADPKQPWSRKQEASDTGVSTKRIVDTRPYLRSILENAQYIDIRGLHVGSGSAQRFEIDRLYIPLTTTLGGRDRLAEGRAKKEQIDELHAAEAEPVDLGECLRHRCLAVLGDPGAGKTTFLRRIAFEACRARLNDSTPDAPWDAMKDRFPIFIPLAALAGHKAFVRKSNGGPVGDDAPEWLAHFAARHSEDAAKGLDETYFRSCLQDGSALVLLDGLDEVPTADERLVMRKLIERAATTYDGCRFVVTTRPAAYVEDVVLAGFEQARIAPLEQDAIETFLDRWCDALWPDSESEAKRHLDELLVPLQKRPEIRRMARNPVMLTALAVVQWHEKQLPEQRSDLYESIIWWLAKARVRGEGRPKPEQCIALLQNLALAMQDHTKGRQTQVTRHQGANAIKSFFREIPEDDRTAAAEEFLSREEIDSGIIIGRGEHDIRFWHLTFQEYLAARGLAARPPQAEVLLKSDKLHEPEWREVVLLLAGVLHRQGIDRVDAMFETVLEQISPKSSLEAKARCAGLLSAVLRDLAPVGYKPESQRYGVILEEVMAVFDAERLKGIPIKDAIAAAEAVGRAGDPRFGDPRTHANWVTIPAGSFLMGAQKTDPSKPNHDPKAYDRESPVHEVRHSAFRIGRYPVTVSEYKHFVDAGGYKKEEHWNAGGFGRWERPDEWDEQTAHANRPVTGVSWYEAAAFAAWAGCRLPTEAEWERAAQGTDARRYPWGADKPSSNLANYEQNVGAPTPVGVYPRGATPDGILDMAGNVWEWCSDAWHNSHEGAPADGSARPAKGEESGRVIRGGAWLSLVISLRSAFRRNSAPGYRLAVLGFRVAVGT